MAIEVDADARPVEARRDLFDVRGLAGAVVALDHHPAVVREARENGERRVGVEPVVVVDVRYVIIVVAERGDGQILIDTELLSDADGGVRH